MAFGNFEFPNANVYDSDLREVLRILRELIDSYNEILQDIADVKTLSEDAIARVAALERQWADITKTINAIIDVAMQKYESDFNTELAKLQKQIDDINQQYSMFVELMDAKDNAVKAYCANLILESNKELIKMIEELRELVEDYDGTMYNPLRGRHEDTEKVVADLYEAERYGGLSNAELSDYDMTNAEFAALNLCNYDIAINLRWIIEDYGVRSTYHAYYGNKTIPYNVDSFLLTQYLGTMSNAEFEELDLTNAEFEALDLTNAEYLSYNSTSHFVTDEQLTAGLATKQDAGDYARMSDLDGLVDTSGSGLTNSQMTTLGVIA